MIYHITTQKEWVAAKTAGVYSPPSLKVEGFIHCATEAQVMQIANFYFRGRTDLVLLEIDESQLGRALRWEKNGPYEFPHVYGPIATDLVARIAPLEAASERGEFENPFKPVLH
jgi:uncharacterized protein (DUF952 family)